MSAPRPPAHRVAAQRRRRVFLALAAVAVVTLVAALLNGGWFLVAHVVADLLLVAYVAAAVRVVRSAAEFEMKVAFLPHRDAGADPATLLQDVARSR